MTETVRDGPDHPVERLDVIVVGAGLSGIGAAWHLRHALPHKSFTMLEARDEIGGTWDLFRYPGIRSDSDLHTYGYGFKPWTDDDAIADGPSIMRYLDETVDENGLRPHIRFGHRVVRAAWSSADACWTVEVERTDSGETVLMQSSWLIATTGYFRYDRGYLPDLPGIERFEGTVVHPQAWPEGLVYEDKRVVVIGSGATAVTLVPAMAEQTAHATMLQRSPTYYITLPQQDALANLARRFLSPERAYAWTRSKNVRSQAFFYRLSRRRPKLVKRLLIRNVAKQLPDGYDVARHFTPTYDPWDQRVCLTPGGDLFRAISSGRASVVTDTIETFTERGIRLASGDELEADIVVTATGLDLLALGGIVVDVDGQRMEAGDRLVYKSVMLSDVPNLAFVFGYTNASWTLKVDLVCEWVCRCIAFLDRNGYASAVPVNRDPAMATSPMLEFGAGYVQRALDRFPRQGTGPWSVAMRYADDARRLREDEIDDGVLCFSRARTRAPAR
jgi:cation diffusion facilitator CzcD-associated flavoprotein CzcO